VLRASERNLLIAAARAMRSLTDAAVAAGGGRMTTLLFWFPGAAVVAGAPAEALDALALALSLRAAGVELSAVLLLAADITTGATALASLRSRRCRVPGAAALVTCKLLLGRGMGQPAGGPVALLAPACERFLHALWPKQGPAAPRRSYLWCSTARSGVRCLGCLEGRNPLPTA
jgi:hypothetical protein